MSNVTKLSAAIILALVAAGINTAWLNAKKVPPQFVALKANVERGQAITDALLAPVPVPGDALKLRKALVPYSQRALLFGLEASRDYTAGDMIFQRDIQAPKQDVAFEILGPFRLISVGERFKEADPESEQGYSPNSGGNNVTIAVSAKFNDQARRLLKIIDPKRDTDEDTPHIVAVQVVPPGASQSSELADSGDDVVYQTVALDGIENVPGVLLAGDVIRFVIPSENTL